MSLLLTNPQQGTGLKVVDDCRESVFSYREIKTQSGFAIPLRDSEAVSYQANSGILPENT